MVHLHLHSVYSLLDGYCGIEKAVKKAKKEGHRALAITDHGFMYGAVEFYRACRAEGIKPIIGVELYTTDNIYNKNKSREAGHLVLLAKNLEGYRNLVKLESIAATEGFYYNPRCDLNLLAKYHEGLVCLSGCISGDLNRKLLADDYEGAKELALRYKEIFGDDYYIELQYHGLEEQKKALSGQIRLAEELGIRMVATNDVHYIEKCDAHVHHLLTCISTKKTVDDETALGYGNPSEWYFKNEEEMRLIFDDIAPGAVEETDRIAEKCELSLAFDQYHLPEFPTPDGWTDNTAYLRALSRAGLMKRYGPAGGKHQDQLDYELQTIERMGFTDYMLIVSDFICYAKKNGIPVGPGRGSAAGSLVSYCLGITDLDPIKFGLKFERFLNPERVTMPDIDIDFDVPDGREAVIAYVADKYGPSHMAQIITFGTLGAKVAVRDVGKALGMKSAETAKLSALIPATPKITLTEALAASPALRKRYNEDSEIKRCIDAAMKVEGLPRNTSVHAAGILLTPSEVSDYIPICRNPNGDGNLALTQFCMADVESMGLLKVDFLGLRTLSVMRDAQARINANRPGEDPFDIWKLDYNDPGVYEMLSRGETKGVFQLESEGMRDVLRKLQPTCLEDLIAVIALYRPGPMESIPKFVAGKKNPEKVSYKHPLLKPILESNYGTIVFQEQVMEIVRELAGYSYGRSDLVRRAMAKKKPDKLDAEKDVFLNGRKTPDGSGDVEGCLARGIPREVAESIWSEMEDFAEYAFNKAHAAAYATMAYRTAYLRRHYPLIFQAAMMTNAIDSPEKLLSFLDDCDSRNIAVLPPDINRSDAGFTVEDGAIRFGLLAIKQTGKTTVREIIMERMGQPYRDMQDLMERCPQSCDKKTIGALIKSGSFDCFPQNRAQMLQALPGMLKVVREAKKELMEEQISLEDSFFVDGSTGTRRKSLSLSKVSYPDVPDLPQREKMEQELEVTGMYISGHPLGEYREIVARKTTHRLSELSAVKDTFEDETALEGEYVVPSETNVRVAGIVTVKKEMTTKKDKSQMAAITITDQSGKLNATVFPKAYAAYGAQLQPGRPVVLFGKVEDGDFGRKLIVNSVEFLDKEV